MSKLHEIYTTKTQLNEWYNKKKIIKINDRTKVKKYYINEQQS